VRPVIRHTFSIRHRGAALEAPDNNIAGGLSLAERSEAQPWLPGRRPRWGLDALHVAAAETAPSMRS